MEIPLKTPITLFVRVKGPRGERELKVILNTFATHMAIPFRDAFRLGYSPLDPHEPIRCGHNPAA
jgi:hypothetical protein